MATAALDHRASEHRSVSLLYDRPERSEKRMADRRRDVLPELRRLTVGCGSVEKCGKPEAIGDQKRKRGKMETAIADQKTAAGQNESGGLIEVEVAVWIGEIRFVARERV